MLTKQLWQDWLNASKRGNARKRPEGKFEPLHVADQIAAATNPLAELQELGREYPHQTYIGMTTEGFVMTPPDTHTLLIGPARSSGKTSGVLCCAALMAPNPVVISSAKLDAFHVTALGRSFVGPILIFSVLPMPERKGAFRARWSPVVGSDDWDVAMATATAAVKAAGAPHGGGGDTAHFFNAKSAELLAAMLFTAATYEKPPVSDDPALGPPFLPPVTQMRWVSQTLQVGTRERDFVPIADRLYRDGHLPPANVMVAFLGNDPRTEANILASAQLAIQPYTLNGVLDACDDPNFFPAEFVRTNWAGVNNFRGTIPTDPDLDKIGVLPNILRGLYSTLYLITGTNPTLTAPVIEALLAQIKLAAHRYFDENYNAGRAREPNTLFIIDELGAGARLGDLDELLAIAGNGVQVIAAIQSFQQLAHRYGDHVAKSLLTLFQNLVVYPGVRDIDLLELIAALGGKFEREIWSMSIQRGQDGKATQSWSMSYQEQDRFPPYAVYNGHQASKDAVLYLPHMGGCYWAWNTPYYRSNPWPATLIRAAKWMLATAGPLDERRYLPLANLDADGQGSYLRQIDKGLYDEYLDVKTQLVHVQRELPQIPPTPPSLHKRSA